MAEGNEALHVHTVALSESEMKVVDALKEADAQLEGLTYALAENSVGGADVGNITVDFGGKTVTFDASDSAAGFIVGQIANKLSQGMSTLVVPETKKDEIAKTVSQKAG